MEPTNFENMKFSPFNSAQILLNDSVDPESNMLSSEDYKNVDTQYVSPQEAYQDLQTTESETFSMLHLNIRSLNKNFEDFKLFLFSLKHEFKVICLSETWAKDHIIANTQFHIPNYSVIHQQRAGNKQGGGVCMYIHKSLSFKILNEFCVSTDHNESLCIEIQNKNSKNKIINVTYRPPDGNTKPFQSYLKTFLTKRNIQSKHVYLIGDVNLNLLDYENNSKVKNFVNLLFQNSMIPVINKPTRVFKDKASIIDHIYTNSLFTHVVNPRIIKTDVTDHFAIYITLNETIENNQDQEKTILKRYFYEHAVENFKKLLQQTDWQFLIQTKCPNQSYEKFEEYFSVIYNQCFPIKKIKLKHKDLLSPWITTGIKKSSRRKQNLYEKYLKTKSQISLEKYKDFKKLFETIKKKSKVNYYNQQITKYKNNAKKTWEIMKEIIGKTKIITDSFPKEIVLENNEVVSNKKRIADEFNNFFVSIGPKLATKIPSSNKTFHSYLKQEELTFSKDYSVTEKELKEVFTSLKINKSPGHDDISVNVIKKCQDEVIKPLQHIFTNSFKQGTFPDRLKIAKVTPIFKTGDKKLLTNYRPISVLSCFSKISEKLMYNRLYDYLETNKLLFKNQYGFRKGYSTEHAILELVDQITNSFEKGYYTLGVFIDLSKAFDTVNHKILLEKLKYYGITGQYLKWFDSYLQGRKQYIVHDQIKTDMKTIHCGVPQGSILGPLLFLLYVNDLYKSSKLLHTIMFADDTNLFFSEKNITLLFKSVNRELRCIAEWFKANKLSLNIKKTNYIIFHPKRKEDILPLKMPQLFIDDKPITRVKETKFLGVIIDENITWKSHISTVENKTAKNLGILYKAKVFLNKKCLKELYFSFVHTYINYANITWGSTTRTKLKKINSKIKQASRIINNEGKYTSAKPLLKSLNILNAYQLNIYHCLNLMYKIKNDSGPEAYKTKFKPISHSYPTAYSRENFSLPKKKTNFSKFSISYRGPYLWNNFLNQELKQENTFFAFKNKLKTFIINGTNEIRFF